MIADQPMHVFDELAGTYDETFTDRLPGLWLRAMVLERVTHLLPNSAKILEVGCGTGEDAIYFAGLGHEVIATDISNGMLQQISLKLAEVSPEVRERIQTSTLDAADPESADLTSDRNLDLVFSNFGALNCVADLGPLFEYAGERLKPGGHLAITLMGRFCLWETLGFALRGDFRRATRRWSGSSQFSASGVVQDIWYPSIGATKRMMPRNLQVIEVYGIGALIPSTNFFGLCERWPSFFRRLSRVDNAVASWWPISRLSDHFLIVLRKERVPN